MNLDKSTVSRAIKNKLLKINGKIKPLRGYIILDEKNEIIKNEIINIIKNEDKKKKLSDQEISNIFFREGKKIGRRTIAKYRNELGIFCSKKRK
jgi:RNA polymerase sigma-54 factor